MNIFSTYFEWLFGISPAVGKRLEENQKIIKDFIIRAVFEIQLVYSLEGAQNVNVAETLTKGGYRGIG